ncbi:LysR family transcriptional regulator [Psychromonas sp. Urea-02u-13]|nr:LysR family transcriptional regulator [Psychromonas sp. Urea-02u-13]
MLGRLKEEMGQALFIRKGRGVVATSATLSLYNQVQTSVHQLSGVFHSFSTFDPSLTTRKFVTTAPEHLQWFLLDHFSLNSNDNVSIEVHDQPGDDEHLYDAMLTQKFDVMVDILPLNKPNIENMLLFESELVVVCSQSHPRINGTLSLEQFFAEEHAVLERTRYKQFSLEHYTDTEVTERKIIYHGRSLFSNMMLVSQSDYLTVVPLSMALQSKDKLSLQIHKPPFDYQKVKSYLIWHRKVTQDPANTWLSDQLIKLANKIKIEKMAYE